MINCLIFLNEKMILHLSNDRKLGRWFTVIYAFFNTWLAISGQRLYEEWSSRQKVNRALVLF